MSSNPIALVVDDNLGILMHATEILEEAGFRTLTAMNGEAALEHLRHFGNDITLLFTDVEMPGSIDGFELARTVYGKWPAISILVASGQINPKEGDLPEGALFIGKPFSAEIVHDHIHKVVPVEKKPEPLKEP